MAHFRAKLGGLGQHPRGEFFFVDRGVLGKIPTFASFLNYEKHPPLFIIRFIIEFIIHDSFYECGHRCMNALYESAL